MSKKAIIITIQVEPPKDGARAIFVSGAPAGEIPEIRAGSFAEMHPLINQVWAALQRREEMKPDPALIAAKDDKKDKAADDEKEEEGEITEETIIPDPAEAVAPAAASPTEEN